MSETKSRLPNKSLSAAEVAKKSRTNTQGTKAAEKSSESKLAPKATEKASKVTSQKSTSSAKSTSVTTKTKVTVKKATPAKEAAAKPKATSAQLKSVPAEAKKGTEDKSKSTAEIVAVKTKSTPKKSASKGSSVKQTPAQKAKIGKAPNHNTKVVVRKTNQTVTINDISAPGAAGQKAKTAGKEIAASERSAEDIPKAIAKPKNTVSKNGPKSRNSTSRTTSRSASQKKASDFITIFSKVIACIFAGNSIFLIAMLAYLNLLPASYLTVIVVIMFLITAGCGILLWHKKTHTAVRVLVNILSIILGGVYLIGGGYIAQVSGFLDNLKPQEYLSEKYYVIIDKNSTMTSVAELKGKAVGTFDESIEIYQKAIAELQDTVSAQLETINSVGDMADRLLSGDLDAIFLSSVYKSVLDEDSSEFHKNTKILYTIKVKVKLNPSEDEPNIDVTSQPFLVYISGNDTYGDLASRGLSDVNMLAAVNPTTHEILLVSIPRDCYVQLHNVAGIKDKLTHAGMYGVQMSIQTIEDLLDLDINYYVKINFPAIVNLVDAIGGIDVYSDKTFQPRHDNRMIYEGVNHFDGDMALAFARERMAYIHGDRHRVQNQRAVLNAIIDKISHSSVILTRTNEILSSLSSNLDTNISKSEISSLVKLQLQDMPSWTVDEFMLDGSDLYTYTYTFNDQLRYVLVPYADSIQAVHDYITGILEGKTLDELNIPDQSQT